MDPAPYEQFTGAAGSGGSSDLALVATQEGWRSRGREKVNSNTNTIQDVQQYDSGNLSDYWPPVYGNSRNNRSLVDMRSSGGREKFSSNTNTIQEVQQYDSGDLSYWPPVHGNSRNNLSLIAMRSSGLSGAGTREGVTRGPSSLPGNPQSY